MTFLGTSDVAPNPTGAPVHITPVAPASQVEMPRMLVRRRHVLLGAATLLPALAATGAKAGAWATDIGVHTEPSLAPALRRVARAFTAQTGIGVAVLAAPAALLLDQIQRNPAEDILAVPADYLDKAQQRGFIDAATRRDSWRNPLVLAMPSGKPRGADAAAILAAGPVAVPDPTIASSLDGRAALTTLGLTASRVLGAANTGDAAQLALDGKAIAALVFATDLHADPRLALAAALPPGAAQSCGFALNADPPSRNARHFWDYLQTEHARSRLAASGLDMVA